MASSDRWRIAVGDFILAMGDLERWICFLIDDLTDRKQRNKLAELTLYKRIKWARGLVVNSSLSDEKKTIYGRQLDQLDELRHKRNTVAHNPLVLAIFEDANGNTCVLPHIKSTKDLIKDIKTKRYELRHVEVFAK